MTWTSEPREWAVGDKLDAETLTAEIRDFLIGLHDGPLIGTAVSSALLTTSGTDPITLGEVAYTAQTGRLYVVEVGVSLELSAAGDVFEVRCRQGTSTRKLYRCESTRSGMQHGGTFRSPPAAETPGAVTASGTVHRVWGTGTANTLSTGYYVAVYDVGAA